MLMSLHFLHNLLSRRKKIGLLATKKWGDKLPKFNSPESKAELKEFAEQISPECGIPEINFTEEGIAQHIKTFFTEQRRYRKSKNPALNRVCVSIKFYNNFHYYSTIASFYHIWSRERAKYDTVIHCSVPVWPVLNRANTDGTAVFKWKKFFSS